MKLANFFTYDGSCEKWQRIGILKREVKLYNELSRLFDKVYFVTYGNKEERCKSFLEGNIEILQNKNLLPSFVYSFIAPIIYKKQLMTVDYIKTNQILCWTAIIAKIFYHKKLIIRQGYQLSLTYKRKGKYFFSLLATVLEFFAYNFADRIIVTTKSQEQFIVKKHKINKNKISTIPNYVDINLFKPLNIQKEKGRLIFVGRLDWEKNLFSLLDAVKDLDVKLVIIGSGPCEDKLKEKVIKENIHNVEFKGIIPNEQLPVELNKSEIYIQPSLYEGNPKTILEAMACSLSVIVTDVNGIKELITHNVNGYLCMTSVSSIRRAIETLLSYIDSQREQIGLEARNMIVENFSLDKILNEEMKLYGKT